MIKPKNAANTFKNKHNSTTNTILYSPAELAAGRHEKHPACKEPTPIIHKVPFLGDTKKPTAIILKGFFLGRSGTNCSKSG